MSENQGARAPEVTMCSHVVEAEMQTPFALYTTKRKAEYLCPQCLADAIERRLSMPGQQPADAASAVSFAHCGHVDGERACWPCLEAACAELVSRWAKLFHQEKSKASQLRRVVAHWRKFYDPQNIQPRNIETIEAGPAQRMTAKQIAAERARRMTRERIQRRHQRIRQVRGFPQTFALQARQAETVVVVPPVT